MERSEFRRFHRPTLTADESANAAHDLKVRDQITFLTPPQTYLKVFVISVPIDGSYFSHAHPEIWCSKIGHLRRNNQKHVKQNSKVR